MEGERKSKVSNLYLNVQAKLEHYTDFLRRLGERTDVQLARILNKILEFRHQSLKQLLLSKGSARKAQIVYRLGLKNALSLIFSSNQIPSKLVTNLARSIDDTSRIILFASLKNRFQAQMYLHPDISWELVEHILSNQPSSVLWSLQQLELQGTEPDVIAMDKKNIIFVETKAFIARDRPFITYDSTRISAELDGGRQPDNGACQIAESCGCDIVDCNTYVRLVTAKPSCDEHHSGIWLKTPASILKRDRCLIAGSPSNFTARPIDADNAVAYSVCTSVRLMLRVSLNIN